MTPRAGLLQRLAELGIVTRTVEHPAVFTVAESAGLDRDIPGGHTKNLFLRDSRGALFLVVAHAPTKVDLKRLSAQLGCGRLSFGSATLMQEVLGVSPGSVTAFAVINDRERRLNGVVVDAALMAYDTVNAHPLENTATTNIARDDLFRFIRTCGYEPVVLYLTLDEPL